MTNIHDRAVAIPRNDQELADEVIASHRRLNELNGRYRILLAEAVRRGLLQVDGEIRSNRPRTR